MDTAARPFQATKTTRVLRLREVLTRTGLGRSTVYALIAEARFPAQVQLSTRVVGWVEAEVDAWIGERLAGRASAARTPGRPAV